MKITKGEELYEFEFSTKELKQFEDYWKLISGKSEYWDCNRPSTKANATLGVYHKESNIHKRGRKELIEALLAFKELQDEIGI